LHAEEVAIEERSKGELVDEDFEGQIGNVGGEVVEVVGKEVEEAIGGYRRDAANRDSTESAKGVVCKTGGRRRGFRGRGILALNDLRGEVPEKVDNQRADELSHIRSP